MDTESARKGIAPTLNTIESIINKDSSKQTEKEYDEDTLFLFEMGLFLIRFNEYVGFSLRLRDMTIGRDRGIAMHSIWSDKKLKEK